MKTLLFIFMAIAMLLWFLGTLRRKPSLKKGCIDVIIPNHFLCGGHHGVFPVRRGVQHLYHLRLDPRQAVQGQCQL